MSNELVLRNQGEWEFPYYDPSYQKTDRIIEMAINSKYIAYSFSGYREDLLDYYEYIEIRDLETNDLVTTLYTTLMYDETFGGAMAMNENYLAVGTGGIFADYGYPNTSRIEVFNLNTFEFEYEITEPTLQQVENHLSSYTSNTLNVYDGYIGSFNSTNGMKLQLTNDDNLISLTDISVSCIIDAPVQIYTFNEYGPQNGYANVGVTQKNTVTIDGRDPDNYDNILENYAEYTPFIETDYQLVFDGYYDDRAFNLNCPFPVVYLNVEYAANETWLNANSIITFGDSTFEYNFDYSYPELPKIFIDYSDGSIHKIYEKTIGDIGNRTHHVVPHFSFERDEYGNIDLIYEIIFHEAEPWRIDILIHHREPNPQFYNNMNGYDLNVGDELISLNLLYSYDLKNNNFIDFYRIFDANINYLNEMVRISGEGFAQAFGSEFAIENDGTVALSYFRSYDTIPPTWVDESNVGALIFDTYSHELISDNIMIGENSIEVDSNYVYTVGTNIVNANDSTPLQPITGKYAYRFDVNAQFKVYTSLTIDTYNDNFLKYSRIYVDKFYSVNTQNINGSYVQHGEITPVVDENHPDYNGFDDTFGQDVFLLDDKIYITSSKYQSIYVFNAETLQLITEFKNPISTNLYFGEYVSFSDSTIACSVFDSVANTNSVLIYDINTFDLLLTINDPNNYTGSMFGRLYDTYSKTIAMTDTRIIISDPAYLNDVGNGIVYVFNIIYGNLIHQTENIHSGTIDFGFAVDLDSQYYYVCCPNITSIFSLETGNTINSISNSGYSIDVSDSYIYLIDSPTVDSIQTITVLDKNDFSVFALAPTTIRVNASEGFKRIKEFSDKIYLSIPERNLLDEKIFDEQHDYSKILSFPTNHLIQEFGSIVDFELLSGRSSIISNYITYSSDSRLNDNFGHDIALSPDGKTLYAYGRTNDTFNEDKVYVIDTETKLVKHIIENPNLGTAYGDLADLFGRRSFSQDPGTTIAAVDNYIIIGAMSEDSNINGVDVSNTGIVYVFDATTYELLYTWETDDYYWSNFFGSKIRAYGDHVLCSGIVSAKLYSLSTGLELWDGYSTYQNSYLGYDIAISDKYFAIGGAEGATKFVDVYDILTKTLLTRYTLQIDRGAVDIIGDTLLVDKENSTNIYTIDILTEVISEVTIDPAKNTSRIRIEHNDSYIFVVDYDHNEHYAVSVLTHNFAIVNQYIDTSLARPDFIQDNFQVGSFAGSLAFANDNKIYFGWPNYWSIYGEESGRIEIFSFDNDLLEFTWNDWIEAIEDSNGTIPAVDTNVNYSISGLKSNDRWEIIGHVSGPHVPEPTVNNADWTVEVIDKYYETTFPNIRLRRYTSPSLYYRDDGFGKVVEISDNGIMAISAPDHWDGSLIPYAGIVYLFDLTSNQMTYTNWIEEPTTASNHYFGSISSISPNGRYLSIGNTVGNVYVYDLISTPTLVATLDSTTGNLQFGRGIASSNDYVAIVDNKFVEIFSLVDFSLLATIDPSIDAPLGVNFNRIFEKYIKIQGNKLFIPIDQNSKYILIYDLTDINSVSFIKYIDVQTTSYFSYDVCGAYLAVGTNKVLVYDNQDNAYPLIKEYSSYAYANLMVYDTFAISNDGRILHQYNDSTIISLDDIIFDMFDYYERIGKNIRDLKSENEMLEIKVYDKNNGDFLDSNTIGGSQVYQNNFNSSAGGFYTTRLDVEDYDIRNTYSVEMKGACLVISNPYEVYYDNNGNLVEGAIRVVKKSTLNEIFYYREKNLFESGYTNNIDQSITKNRFVSWTGDEVFNLYDRVIINSNKIVSLTDTSYDDIDTQGPNFFWGVWDYSCGCKITYITSSTLYNDYLPLTETEHNDDYPEVAMENYEFYKKIEYTADSEPEIFEIVSGELPNGLDIDLHTLEITGIPTLGCNIENGNIPFNQWHINEDSYRQATPSFEYTIIIKADCDEDSFPYTIPVYPNWTPYKDALNNSEQYFERPIKNKIITEYEYTYEKTIGSELCPCGTELTTEIKTSTIIENKYKYQHNDLIEHFETESTCTPFRLTENNEQLIITEEKIKPKVTSKLKPIDKTGLCCEE